MAERSILTVLELHQQLQVKVGEADDLRVLGRLYLCKQEFGKAEKARQAAFRIDREIEAPFEAIWRL